MNVLCKILCFWGLVCVSVCVCVCVLVHVHMYVCICVLVFEAFSQSYINLSFLSYFFIASGRVMKIAFSTQNDSLRLELDDLTHTAIIAQEWEVHTQSCDNHLTYLTSKLIIKSFKILLSLYSLQIVTVFSNFI